MLPAPAEPAAVPEPEPPVPPTPIDWQRVSAVSMYLVCNVLFIAWTDWGMPTGKPGRGWLAVLGGFLLMQFYFGCLALLVSYPKPPPEVAVVATPDAPLPTAPPVVETGWRWLGRRLKRVYRDDEPKQLPAFATFDPTIGHKPK